MGFWFQKILLHPTRPLPNGNLVSNASNLAKTNPTSVPSLPRLRRHREKLKTPKRQRCLQFDIFVPVSWGGFTVEKLKSSGKARPKNPFLVRDCNGRAKPTVCLPDLDDIFGTQRNCWLDDQTVVWLEHVPTSIGRVDLENSRYTISGFTGSGSN